MTSGVFTLPLFGIDTSSGCDNRRAGEGSWGFITGPENHLLRVLIDAADCDVPRYNPITLFGPTGVGKSHLLLGVLNQVRTFASQRTCCYLTGADLARQYARAIELDTLSELREKLAGTRFLIIDGLDELASKPAALGELLHVVDRSVERQSQLLLSCQSSNAQWSWMSSALRSRLEGGLLIPVSLPAPATRTAMIRQLGSELGVDLPDDSQFVRRQVASRDTYRDLRHAIFQLAAVQERDDGDPVLAESEPRSRGNDLAAIRGIGKRVARHFEMKFSDLAGPSRRKTIVQARGVAIYLAKSLLRVSYDQLGKAFGNRDHTTVLHAYQKIATSLNQDLALRQTIEHLSEELATQKV